MQNVIKTYEQLKDVVLEEDEDKLDQADESASIDDYNAMRMEVYDKIRDWYYKTGETIRERPGTRPEMKEKSAM